MAARGAPVLGVCVLGSLGRISFVLDSESECGLVDESSRLCWNLYTYHGQLLSPDLLCVLLWSGPRRSQLFLDIDHGDKHDDVLHDALSEDEREQVQNVPRTLVQWAGTLGRATVHICQLYAGGVLALLPSNP